MQKRTESVTVPTNFITIDDQQKTPTKLDLQIKNDQDLSFWVGKHTLKFWKPKRGGRTNILNLLETAQQASSTAGYPSYASISCKHTACTLNMTINLITNLMKIVIHIFQFSLLLLYYHSENNIFRICRPSHCCKPPPWPAWQTDPGTTEK